MASMHELRNRVEKLAYLGDASKVLATLANEYGRDHRMPSRRYVEDVIADRKAKVFRRHYQRTEVSNENVARLV
jgi:hypothetical protein